MSSAQRGSGRTPTCRGASLSAFGVHEKTTSEATGATDDKSPRTMRVCRICFLKAYAKGGYTRRTYACNGTPASIVTAIDPSVMGPFAANCSTNGGAGTPDRGGSGGVVGLEVGVLQEFDWGEVEVSVHNDGSAGFKVNESAARELLGVSSTDYLRVVVEVESDSDSDSDTSTRRADGGSVESGSGSESEGGEEDPDWEPMDAEGDNE